MCNLVNSTFSTKNLWEIIHTFQISGLGSQVVYRPVDIIGSEIPHCVGVLNGPYACFNGP